MPAREHDESSCSFPRSSAGGHDRLDRGSLERRTKAALIADDAIAALETIKDVAISSTGPDADMDRPFGCGAEAFCPFLPCRRGEVCPANQRAAAGNSGEAPRFAMSCTGIRHAYVEHGAPTHCGFAEDHGVA
jgi:hypothetical protein